MQPPPHDNDNDAAPLYPGHSGHNDAAAASRFFGAAPSGYAPVVADDEPVSSSSSSSAAPAQPPSGTQSKQSKALEAAKPNTTDGVFANLGVVNTSAELSEEHRPPPTYRDVFADNVAIAESDDRGALPHYLDNAVNVVAEDGEVLIDGLPVGDFFSFMANLFVSITFDFMGYMMTTMLATTYAARCGSRSGLGLTFIRYGFLVLEKDQEVEEATYKYDPDNYEQTVAIGKQNDFIAYLMVAFGFFLMLRANADFIRAKRLQAVMIQAADNNNNA
ncbi:hypothetical protein BDR26DRAFT_870693 [Obelidium mucronatum]|nr:hypothetical protein BDR26DRAFT_870693 [Obelidium mucronatum]